MVFLWLVCAVLISSSQGESELPSLEEPKDILKTLTDTSTEICRILDVLVIVARETLGRTFSPSNLVELQEAVLALSKGIKTFRKKFQDLILYKTMQATIESTKDFIDEAIVKEALEMSEPTLEIAPDTSKDTFSDRAGLLPDTFLYPSYIATQGEIGQDYPDYSFIPQTSFSCSDKDYIPGFYADIETRCQVFHVCWPRRRESYLCPTGSTFNQQTLSCDEWYNSICSLSPDYYYLNEKLAERYNRGDIEADDFGTNVEETLSLPGQTMKYPPYRQKTLYYPQILIDSSEEELDDTVDSNDEDLDTSPRLAIEDFAKDIYGKFFDKLSDTVDGVLEPSADEDDSESSVSSEYLVREEKKRDMFHSVKIDKAGLLAENQKPGFSTEATSEQNSRNFSNEKTNERVGIPLVRFTKHVSKKNIAPEIVSKVLDTSEDIVREGILPLANDILALAFGKSTKAKKN